MQDTNNGKPHFMHGVMKQIKSLAYPSGTATGVNGLLRWTPK
jgi:hypothetical protein